jgi:hypothetical protein
MVPHGSLGSQMPYKPGPSEMRREQAFYSEWCRLFEFHLKRLRWSASAFAVKANRSQQAIHSYLCGRARPPLDQVPLWAAMLGLRGEERDRFISAAQEAHTPPAVWKRLLELEAGAKSLAALPPSELADQLILARGIIAELVRLLQEIEDLFYLRKIPPDRIRAVRDTLGVAIRRAVERYAITPPGASP